MESSFFLTLIEKLVVVGKQLHFPVMFTAIVLGISFRYLVYFTTKRHEWFSFEFEKRVGRFLQQEHDQKTQNISFYLISKKLLERTFYEVFEFRDKYKRRKADGMMSSGDRIFLIKSGTAWLVNDLLKQIRFLRYGAQQPNLLGITKNTFLKNPYFNNIFGIIPSATVNEVLNILPGLFVIGGIFGTFLGVMKGIPELSGMDLNDAEKTKVIMDRFLVDVATSMGASLTGIFFSVIQTLFNTWFSPERVFVDTVDRFENNLDLLWNYANSNEVPSGVSPFDEHRDPIEALAEASINQELGKRKHTRDQEGGPKQVA